ncbi:putative effector protein [Blumeria hordei DH14]|uniref:Putative effector protein n=1 Tax=Blumeria graminis f. sp. hordei (strain DH14) TaxID=546991 RepID=N1JP25_BLUG1|nr:putative effector protein [Blumeria hordei DH14]
MSSLFLNGEIFAKSATELEQNALAWYQGHLHLFKQNLRTNEWTPVTLIGSEVKTGSLITNHILEALPDSKLRWTEFYKMKEDIIWPYNPWNFRKSTRYDVNSQEIKNFLYSSERYEDKFILNYPFFDSNYRRRVLRFHESLRIYFGKDLRTLRRRLTPSKKLSHQKLMPSPVTGTMSPFEEKVITKG